MNQDENTGNIVIIEYYDIKEEELYKITIPCQQVLMLS